MGYKLFLEQALGGYFDTIVNEADYNNTGTNTLVIRELQGTMFRNSKIQPIQLTAYSDDIDTTKKVLNDFAKNYSKTNFNVGLEFYIQEYGTAFASQLFSQSGANYTNQIILSGTLIISENARDVSKLEIDGEELEFDNVDINCVISGEPTKPVDSEKATTNNISMINNITLIGINKNDAFGNKLSLIRRGKRSIVDPFNISITFVDGLVENYTMYLSSSTVVSSNANVPLLTVVLTE